ncbi:argininosuccinate lyase [Enterococcus sp. BWB1-3]|uniref:argininosuccinate lyase n=1 Tax=Enterococcus sp. BWB1-3 TaxID=2787713 RepID=UPI0019236093|nr:argininosuccinate lyase [Enterococcus sp. BWB1-3]MBL1229994.1 argininosuccinate lyase [Enterococcus sp. BWB1-3]
MEMVLPQNYVEVTEEEMMYLDGGGLGKHWYNKRGNVACIIDVAAAAIAGWGAISSAIKVRKLLKSNVGKRLTSGVAVQLSRYFGSAVGKAFSAALNIGLTICSASIGSIAAMGLDKVDGRYDGYIFA